MTLFAIVLFDVRPFPLLVIIKNKVIKLIKKILEQKAIERSSKPGPLEARKSPIAWRRNLDFSEWLDFA